MIPNSTNIDIESYYNIFFLDKFPRPVIIKNFFLVNTNIRNKNMLINSGSRDGGLCSRHQTVRAPGYFSLAPGGGRVRGR